MHFEGAIEAPISPARFYSFVTTPADIISILPDVEESKVSDGDHFSIRSRMGMSYIRGAVSMNFEIAEKRKNASVRMIGHGQGVQSSIDLTMTITLEEYQGGTKARWFVEAIIGGLLASVGSRILGSAAEKYVKLITENLRQKVSDSA